MFGVARNFLFEKIFKTLVQNLQYDINNIGTRLLSTCYSNFCWILFQDKWVKANHWWMQNLGGGGGGGKWKIVEFHDVIIIFKNDPEKFACESYLW